MPDLENITYPFRLASWKTARFFQHPDEDTRSSNMNKVIAGTALATMVGMIGAVNVSPDDNHIEGQSELVASYKEQIDSISSIQQVNMDNLRKEWRMASSEEKAGVDVKLNIAENDFQEDMFELLASLYTEDKISEEKIDELFSFVDENIALIETIKFGDKDLTYAGDSAHLNECQVANYVTGGNIVDRAIDISECTEKRDGMEFARKASSPIIGLLSIFLLIPIAGMFNATPLPEKLEEIAKRPRPEIKRRNIY